MTRTHKLINVAGIVLPFVGLVVAIVVLWERMVGPTELAILAVGYCSPAPGSPSATTGSSRTGPSRPIPECATPSPCSGRWRSRVTCSPGCPTTGSTTSSRTRKATRTARMSATATASSVRCVGSGTRTRGWLFSAAGRAEQSRYAKDLMRDRGMRVIAKLFLPLVLFSLALPAVVGWLLIGGWYGFFAGLFWGGAVRIFLLHHVTFSINSICHFWGRRRFAASDESRNVWWLSWISFGESWHNNHHAFPSSAFHGLRRRRSILVAG